MITEGGGVACVWGAVSYCLPCPHSRSPRHSVLAAPSREPSGRAAAFPLAEDNRLLSGAVSLPAIVIREWLLAVFLFPSDNLGVRRFA